VNTVTEGETRVRRRGAVILPNEVIYDQTLSYNAIGLLAIMLARPEDAPKGYRQFVRPGVGQKAILSGFKELREAGYRYQLLRNKATAGARPKLVTDTYVSDTPMSLEEAKRWHFETHGVAGWERGEREAAMQAGEDAASKGSLASLSVAHKSDAHISDAHKRVAQDKNLPVLEKNTQGKSIIGAAAENEAPKLGLTECKSCHYYFRPTSLDAATICGGCNEAAERAAKQVVQPAPEIGPARAAVRAMLDASRSPRAAVERAKNESLRSGLDREPGHG